MTKNIFSILKNNFEWMKKDLVLLIILILLTTFSLRFVKVNGFFQFVILGILLFKTIIFVSVYSFLPSTKFGKDQFSWKFLQGLPLTKKELIFSMSLSSLLTVTPFVLWFSCFWPQISATFYSDFLLSKFFINFLLLYILGNILGVIYLIEYPRKEYQKKNANNQLIRFLRNSLTFVSAIAFLGISLDYIGERFNVDILEICLNDIESLWEFINSWWSVPIIIALIIASYFRALKIWTNEKISYHSNVWNPKKEYTLIVGSCVLLFVAYTIQDFNTPELYRGRLTKAVYQNKYDVIKKELEANSDISVRNKQGMTAMLVAIREGNIEMAKFLENKGASFEGSITNKKNKERFGFNALMLAIDSKNTKMLEYIISKKIKGNEFNKETGFYPIHLATYYCKSQMLDLLIKDGSDVNSLNDKGETPLIVAAKRGCLSAAVTLKEAGATFDIADKKGQKALDRIPNEKYYSEFKYFIEKNSRIPSSIK